MTPERIVEALKARGWEAQAILRSEVTDPVEVASDGLFKCESPAVVRALLLTLLSVLVLPGTAQATTIGSVAGLYHLGIACLILCVFFVGGSLVFFSKSGWTLRKDWWRLWLLLLASLLGVVVFSIPLAGLLFG